MSLPNGAVAVVVVSFIFSPLARFALVWRLWSRRIMRLKLSLNDYAAILGEVNISELNQVEDILGTIQLTYDRSLRLGQPQFSSLVSLLPWLNHDKFLYFTLDSGFRGGIRSSFEERSSKWACNSPESKTFLVPIAGSFYALTAAAIRPSATSVGSRKYLRQIIHRRFVHQNLSKSSVPQNVPLRNWPHDLLLCVCFPGGIFFMPTDRLQLG